MKKIFVFVMLIFLSIPCYAMDFNEQKLKIDNAINAGKYKKAMKLVDKIKKDQKITEEQLLFLNEKYYFAETKINEKKFWSRYHVEHDRFTKSTKYYPKFYTIFPLKLIIIKNQNNNISIYADFNISYFANSFLGAESVIFDQGDNLTLTPLINKEFKATSCGMIGCTFRETFKYQLLPDDIEKFRAIANSPECSYRVYGKNSFKEFKLGQDSQRAIRNMTALYDVLKNNE